VRALRSDRQCALERGRARDSDDDDVFYLFLMWHAVYPAECEPFGSGFVAWCPSLVSALASCLVCLRCLVGLVGSSCVQFLVRAAVPFWLLI
jgi:hypothetical protein